MAQHAQSQAQPAARSHYRWINWARILVLFLYAMTMVAIVLLVMAFFLKLFDASTSAPFVRWVYKSSERVLAPFRGIFPTVEGESGSVLDFSILFAILMYGILALAIRALIEWLDRKLVQLKLEARQEAMPAPDPWAPAFSAGSAPQPPRPRTEVRPGPGIDLR